MGVPVPENEQDACRCGRIAKKIHCPTCGSYTVYASGTEVISEKTPGKLGEMFVSACEAKLLSGGVVINAFRCRRCSHRFCEWEWQYLCEAPVYATRNMMERRRSEELARSLQEAASQVGPDRKAQLAAIFRARGLIGQDVADKYIQPPPTQAPSDDHVASQNPEDWKETNPMFTEPLAEPKE